MAYSDFLMNLCRCKLFDVKDFFSNEMLKYLSERKDRYHWLIMQCDVENSCSILSGEGSMIGNQMFSEFVPGKHFHWVIWRDFYLHFPHSSMNRFMKIWKKDWNSLRFNPGTSCDCGPLYTSRRVYQLESVVKTYKDTDTRKIVDCSYPPSNWDEFVKNVEEKIGN